MAPKTTSAQETPQAIAIDGPGASGKTTVGQILAARLGYHFIDTGIMYRAVTAAAVRESASLEDESTLERLARSVRLQPKNGGYRVKVGDMDLTEELHTPAIDRLVSGVSMKSRVREALVQTQRELAAQGGVVMVGRDIGTVVLPDAPLKIFLGASPEERARRRFEESREGGEVDSYQGVLDDLKRRDLLDSQRAISPMTAAEDACHVDTNDHTVDEVVDTIWQLLFDS